VQTHREGEKRPNFGLVRGFSKGEQLEVVRQIGNWCQGRRPLQTDTGGKGKDGSCNAKY